MLYCLFFLHQVHQNDDYFCCPHYYVIHMTGTKNMQILSPTFASPCCQESKYLGHSSAQIYIYTIHITLQQTRTTLVDTKTSHKMPAYKLMYFDTKGRAEVIRLAFAAAGQSFEDKRFPLSMEEWQAVKPSMYIYSFRQIRVLQIHFNNFIKIKSLLSEKIN